MKRNRSLNFFLPHNYGGFGDPLPDLKHLNLFTEEIDIPQIKPRTVNQNHEFYVKVPSGEESSAALTRDETEPICFPPTFQQNIHLWQTEGEGKRLAEKIEEKRAQLQREQDELEKLKRSPSFDRQKREGSIERGGAHRDNHRRPSPSYKDSRKHHHHHQSYVDEFSRRRREDRHCRRDEKYSHSSSSISSRHKDEQRHCYRDRAERHHPSPPNDTSQQLRKDKAECKERTRHEYKGRTRSDDRLIVERRPSHQHHQQFNSST